MLWWRLAGSDAGTWTFDLGVMSSSFTLGVDITKKNKLKKKNQKDALDTPTTSVNLSFLSTLSSPHVHSTASVPGFSAKQKSPLLLLLLFPALNFLYLSPREALYIQKFSETKFRIKSKYVCINLITVDTVQWFDRSSLYYLYSYVLEVFHNNVKGIIQSGIQKVRAGIINLGLIKLKMTFKAMGMDENVQGEYRQKRTQD